MKMKSLRGIFYIALVFLTGCSTAEIRMMPNNENGVHKVVAKDIEKGDAEVEAVKAANKYCKEQKRGIVFLTEKTEYMGSMDEKTRNAIRKASKVAMILGQGEIGEEKGGLGKAGEAAGAATSDRDYVTTIEFKCTSEG